MTKRPGSRNRKGASLFLIAGAAFLLAVLIYLGFQYVLLTGGSREVRNAVDAAVLNLSKRVCEVKVPPGPGFDDCADTSGQISMANINRVWGKAYLINANADEMMAEGLSTGNAASAAASSYTAAEATNSQLRACITNKGTLDVLFSHLANKRGAPLIGANQIKTDRETMYKTALVDRGAESNLDFNPTALPKTAQSQTPQVRIGKSTYIPGYKTFKANNRTFCFTPFRFGETPHLISDTYFAQNRSDSHPLSDFDLPIPNSFQGSGTAFGSGTALAAAASAVVNPMRKYTMAIPHGFIRIRFSAMSKWMIDSKHITSIPYDATTGKAVGIKDYKLKGSERLLTGWAILGTELNRASLLGILEALPGDKTPAFERILQRVREIDPDYTMDSLQNLMRKCTPDASVSDYYIFPRYRTEDMVDPEMDMKPDGRNLPGWLQKLAAAEGGDKEVVTEKVLEDHEHTFVYIENGRPTECPKWLEITGTMRWRPGTGAGQCLGNLYVDRLTTVKYKPETEN